MSLVERFMTIWNDNYYQSTKDRIRLFAEYIETNHIKREEYVADTQDLMRQIAERDTEIKRLKEVEQIARNARLEVNFSTAIDQAHSYIICNTYKISGDKPGECSIETPEETKEIDADYANGRYKTFSTAEDVIEYLRREDTPKLPEKFSAWGASATPMTPEKEKINEIISYLEAK